MTFLSRSRRRTIHDAVPRLPSSSTSVLVALVGVSLGCSDSVSNAATRTGSAAVAAIRLITVASLCDTDCVEVQIDTVVRAIPTIGVPLETAPHVGRISIEALRNDLPRGLALFPADFPGDPNQWLISTFMVTEPADPRTTAIGVLVRKPNGERRAWYVPLRWTTGGWKGNRDEASYVP